MRNYLCLVVASVLGLAVGSDVAASPPARLSAEQQRAWESEGFLARHPDVRFRKEGLLRQGEGNHSAALNAFRKAARHADKPSQAMIAEMFWQGTGLARDPAQAYAWMDLAAERGYSLFTVKREQYWAALDDAQRVRAIEIGQDLYAEFGDEVAKPRLDLHLRRGRYATTGSRVGAVGPLKVMLAVDGLWVTVSGEAYYKPDYWKDDRYHALTDAIWGGWPDGSVEVGPPQSATGKHD